MKRVIVLTIVFILALASTSHAIVTEGVDNVNCGYTGVNETGSALMKGFYQDQTAAASRVNARHNDFPTTTINWDLTCNSTFADCGKWHGYTLSGSALAKTEHFYFPITGATCPDGGSPWGLSDTDGDGIADANDPFPSDSSDVQCAKLHWQTNPSGTVIWEKWKCINTNGGKTYVEFGTQDPDDRTNRVTTTLGQTWVDGSEILGGSGSGGLLYADKSNDGGTGSTSTGGTTVTKGDGTSSDGTGTGTGSDPGDSDGTTWKKTTDNTKITADNTKVAADLIAESNKKLDDQNEILKKIEENTEKERSNFEHDSTGDFEGEDYSESEDLELQSKLDTLATLYKDRFEEFMDNLKTSAFIGTQLSYFENLPESTDSVIEVNIGQWGNAGQQSASIDLGAYSSSFQVMRTILMVVCGFFCIRIILLKKG